MKKILITGCGGMLGSAVYPYFKNQGYDVLATDIDLNEKWLEFMDIRDMEESEEKANNLDPDAIIHLAALTNLEYCEENLEEAYETNFIGTRNIAQICKRKDIPLVHVSTAGVFDGTKYSYTEGDIPNPINVYGKTKFYGEIAVENILEKHFILRAGWMVGGGKKDKKFVSYICSQVKNGNKEFNVVNDKFGVPTYTKDFALNMEKIMRTTYYGKYHMTGLGEASRYEIAKYIIEKLDVKGAKINSVSSDFFKKDFSVERADSERMINTNLTKINLNLMRGWKEGLEEYLKDEYPFIGKD